MDSRVFPVIKTFRNVFEFRRKRRLLSNALFYWMDVLYSMNLLSYMSLSLYLLMFSNSSRCKTDQKYKLLSQKYMYSNCIFASHDPVLLLFFTSPYNRTRFEIHRCCFEIEMISFVNAFRGQIRFQSIFRLTEKQFLYWATSEGSQRLNSSLYLKLFYFSINTYHSSRWSGPHFPWICCCCSIKIAIKTATCRSL